MDREDPLPKVNEQHHNTHTKDPKSSTKNHANIGESLRIMLLKKSNTEQKPRNSNYSNRQLRNAYHNTSQKSSENSPQKSSKNQILKLAQGLRETDVEPRYPEPDYRNNFKLPSIQNARSIDLAKIPEPSDQTNKIQTSRSKLDRVILLEKSQSKKVHYLLTSYKSRKATDISKVENYPDGNVTPNQFAVKSSKSDKNLELNSTFKGIKVLNCDSVGEINSMVYDQLKKDISQVQAGIVETKRFIRSSQKIAFSVLHKKGQKYSVRALNREI